MHVNVSQPSGLLMGSAVPIRSAKEIAGMRAACRLAREILDKGHAAVKPGVTTDEIDRIVSQLISTVQAMRQISAPASVSVSVSVLYRAHVSLTCCPQDN